MDLTTISMRRLLVLLAAVLALTLTALPVLYTAMVAPIAQAAQIEPDAGLFALGTAQVAKAFEFCEKGDDGLVDFAVKPDSPGLGLPDPGNPKNAWWGIRVPVMSAVKGDGDLVACGFLTAMVDEVSGAELGAACGASKGWNGQGTIEWAADPLPPKEPKTNGITQLEDIGWKVSIAGTLLVTANMVNPKDKDDKIGFLEATVQALGNGCTEKGPGQPAKGDPKDGDGDPTTAPQGANEFLVTGVYEAVRHHGKGTNPPKKEELPGGDDKKKPHQKND